LIALRTALFEMPLIRIANLLLGITALHMHPHAGLLEVGGRRTCVKSDVFSAATGAVRSAALVDCAIIDLHDSKIGDAQVATLVRGCGLVVDSMLHEGALLRDRRHVGKAELG
jgi:hypothetical protein